MAQPIVGLRRAIGNAMDPQIARLHAVTDHSGVKRTLLVLLLAAVIMYPHFESDPTRINAAAYAEIYVLLALGLNVVVGFAGLLDLGYAAFFAIGAYTIALLGSAHFTVSGHEVSGPLLTFGAGGIHVNFFLLIPISAVVAAMCGVLFGAPTLRLRGDYLAIVTLGFGEIVPQVIKNLGPNNSLGLPNITNGVNDITGIDRPPDINLVGQHWTFQTNDPVPWFYFGLIMIIISVLIIVSLRQSRLGRAWAAIREDEIAAAHMGINITRTRLSAFGLGAAFSGFAGLLQASTLGSADYVSFGFNVSLTILVMVILGGIGSVPGAILGAILLSYLDLSWLNLINDKLQGLGSTLHTAPSFVGAFGTWLAQVNLQTAHPLIFGLILVTVMLLRPQGLWPSATRARELKPQTADILAEEDAELATARGEA